MPRGVKTSPRIRKLMVRMYTHDMSAARIGKVFDLGTPTILRILKQEGVVVRAQGAWAWSGDKKEDQNGYIWVRCPEEFWSMLAGKTPRVPEHRLVVAKYLGRPLERFETVHHIDGDRRNNEIGNLQLRVGNHGNGQCYECLDCGSSNIKPVAIRSLPAITESS